LPGNVLRSGLSISRIPEEHAQEASIVADATFDNRLVVREVPLGRSPDLGDDEPECNHGFESKERERDIGDSFARAVTFRIVGAV
jgi:hypothetical protein